MAAGNVFFGLLRRAGAPAAALITISFFGGFAVFGPNGIAAYGTYKREYAQEQVRYAALQRRVAVLKNHVRLLDLEHPDPDMIEEQAHAKLNVFHPDEVIVPLR